jgi:hypothetical protein
MAKLPCPQPVLTASAAADLIEAHGTARDLRADDRDEKADY